MGFKPARDLSKGQVLDDGERRRRLAWHLCFQVRRTRAGPVVIEQIL